MVFPKLARLKLKLARIEMEKKKAKTSDILDTITLQLKSQESSNPKARLHNNKSQILEKVVSLDSDETNTLK